MNIKMGSIKWYSEEKGLGIISHDDTLGDDVFFSLSTIKSTEGLQELCVGDSVLFLTKSGSQGPIATYIERPDFQIKHDLNT